MEEQVKKFNPNDYNGYKNLVNFTEKIFDKLHVQIEKLIKKEPTSRAATAWIKSQRQR